MVFLNIEYGIVQIVIEYARIKSKHDIQHYNPIDKIFNLDRQDQMIMFCLRTGHTRLKHYLFHMYRVKQYYSCRCGHPHTPEHALQYYTLK